MLLSISSQSIHFFVNLNLNVLQSFLNELKRELKFMIGTNPVQNLVWKET